MGTRPAVYGKSTVGRASDPRFAVIGCNCDLGEGLFVGADGLVAWVDIAKSQLFLFLEAALREFQLPVRATVIFGKRESSLILGSEYGLGLFSTESETYSTLLKFSDEWCAESHRTNDGCRLGCGEFLIGTMNKTNPQKVKGSILRIGPDGAIRLVDDDIYIPNLFIECADGSVLISDSARGVIYRYSFDGFKGRPQKSRWYSSDDGYIPDGGCRLADGVIAVAMWDGACIRLLDDDGLHIRDIPVPAKRPTNCKLSIQDQLLWITSAREGLLEDDLREYPDSGMTFSVPVTFDFNR